MPPGATDIERALAAYPELADPSVERLSGGLIHESFSVDVEFILQRVNPIFAPGIHDNIVAVTEHLHARGFETLRVRSARDGRPCVDLGAGGLWRLITRLPGVTFDTCVSPEQARSAGNLVARFHSALHDLEHDFRPLGIPLHDTASYLKDLESALATERGHRLYEAVAPLADAILSAASGLSPVDALPRRVVHGDLKFNNILFEGQRGAEKERALSLIDLDTLSRMPLAIELGDAWRSWCNRAGEDQAEAELDLELFRAAVEGYQAGLSIELEPAERDSLAEGLDRIALELAARFACDALRESYFGWDPGRFPSAGDHNLTRARGQLSLYRQARATLDERRRLLSG